MTRRPARQPHSAAAPRVDDSASRQGGWMEGPARDARADHIPGYDTLLAATDASERRAIETASRTAAALGSVASWIERAQEQLTESTRAAAQSQDQTATVLQGAVGTLSERLSRIESQVGGETSAVANALQAIERIETRLTERSERASAPMPPRLDETLRSFESRLEALNDRIASSPRPIGRRGLAPDSEVTSAVAEIRSHQAMLDRHGHGEMPRPTLPALGTLARSQTAILTTMRADIAKLSTRLETATPPAGELTHEVGTLRDSLGGLATRTDLDRLEKSIRSLTSDIADLRTADRGAANSHEMATLQAEIRRLAEARGAAGAAHDPSGLEVLSHKLDILAASGVDPSVVSSLARQVDDVRQLLAGAAAPQALSLVNAHLDDLRREVAAVGGRQLHPDAFASIQATLNDIRSSLTALGPAQPVGPDVARAMRDFGHPIETMLASLAETVERVERRIHDPAALDGLQRQLSDMAGRIGAPTRDPSVAALEQSMGELLREVAGLRDGTVAMAERAARAAVAETIGAMPVAHEVEQHLRAIRDHYTATEARTTQSLASVHDALEAVMRRMANLEGYGSGRSASAAGDGPGSARGGASRPAGAPDRRVSGQADRRQASPVGLDHSGLPAGEPDEILLEPGAARPRPSAPAEEPAGRDDAAALEADDVRSHFIAAARRAAQAAQSETSGSRRKDAKAAAQPRASSGLGAAEIVRKLRRMIDAKRRPLLLSAAALVLAVGTLQMVRNLTAEGPPSPSAPSRQSTAQIQPAPAPLPPPTAARDPAATPAAMPTPERIPARSFSDPLTTQSIGARIPASSDERPGASPNRDDARRAPPTSALPTAEKEAARIADAASAAPTGVPLPPSLARGPTPSEPVPALPLNIRQAALGGNPVALFDLAARTADGRGVARDNKAALALFEKAADKGFAPAQYRIGNIYERGLGVPRDLDQARSWYRRAAEGGNVRAMHNLAVLMAEGGGGAPDYGQAVGWFTKAADFGVRDSQFNLAVLHARGLGTPQDLGKSYLWLALAAAQGDEDAGRKRDEVGARLGAPDLVRAKAEVARWRAATPNPAANEVQVPAEGFPDMPVKRASRDTRTN